MPYDVQMTPHFGQRARRCIRFLLQQYPLIGRRYLRWTKSLSANLRVDPHNIRTATLAGTEGTSFFRYTIVTTFGLPNAVTPLAEVGIQLKASVCDPEHKVVIFDGIDLWAADLGSN
jgi:hypothetical protein